MPFFRSARDKLSVCAQIAYIRRVYLAHEQAMLTEIYIGALLVDEELADQVWAAWNAGDVDDKTTCIAWMLIVMLCSR